MTAKSSPPAARAAVREIGRHTVIRLVGYYLFAGGLLLLVSAMLRHAALYGSAYAWDSAIASASAIRSARCLTSKT